jgi:type I restriction enzyme M protein
LALPAGVMATVLANGSLSSNTSGEGDIRTKMVKDGIVDCIVALPKQLFYNTGIPATIWILRRGKTKRINETLFIDASEMGYLKDRVHREFTPEDIKKIEDTYHNWRKEENYGDIKGFCKSANIEDIEKHGFVLTPGRYVGITHQEDDGISYEEKIEELQATLKAQIEKEAELNEKIKVQLAKVGIEL